MIKIIRGQKQDFPTLDCFVEKENIFSFTFLKGSQYHDLFYLLWPMSSVATQCKTLVSGDDQVACFLSFHQAMARDNQIKVRHHTIDNNVCSNLSAI